MKRIRGSLLIMAAVAAAALTGCGSSAGSGTASSVSSPTTAASSSSEAGGSSGSSSMSMSTDLATAQSSLGQIIVDGRGMTVYIFDKDVANSGKSSCAGTCATIWPPVVAKGDTPSVSGVTGKVGTITATDGKSKQLTINGLPVYYFAKDSAPGDVKGQGVQNVWWVLDPAGTKISMMAPASSAPASSAPASSGY
jgi:predicted lipoprotein with Yx(FWY)xxD motif